MGALTGKKQAIEGEVEQLRKERNELQVSIADTIRTSLAELAKALEKLRTAGSVASPAEGGGKE